MQPKLHVEESHVLCELGTLCSAVRQWVALGRWG
jgi:hypothetical protein